MSGGGIFTLRDRSIDAMPFASVLAEVDPSLQDFVSRKRAWLDHCMHMDGFMYEAPLGLDSE